MTTREHIPAQRPTGAEHTASAEPTTAAAAAPREGGEPHGLRGVRGVRAAARSLRAHAETWRPYTLAYPGLVGLAGAALSGADGLPEGPGGAGRLLVAWAAPTLGWVSGHYLGDWFDRDLDAVSKPQRPLPSGRLGQRTALACGIGTAMGAAVAAAFVNWRTVVLFAVAMAGIVAYSRLFKGRGLTGNAVRGALTATTVVFGSMTVSDLPSWQVLLFAGVFGAQDTASNLVGTLRDVRGDRRGGYETVPVRHGTRVAVLTAAALHATALAAAAGALATVARPYYGTGPAVGAPVLLLSAAACGTAAFVPLLRAGAGTEARGGTDTDTETDTRNGTSTDEHDGPAPNAAADVIDPRRALRSHEILVAERMLLAGALLAAGWGTAPALAVTVPLLAVSLLAQSRMRCRHEFPDSRTPEGAGVPGAGSTAARNGYRGDVTPC